MKQNTKKETTMTLSKSLTIMGLCLLASSKEILANSKKKRKCHKYELVNVALNSRVQADPNCVLTKVQQGTIDFTKLPYWNYVSANFEPCIAVNPIDPQNIIITTQVARPFRNIPILYTLDGGKHWQSVSIPNSRCSAPVVDQATNDFGQASDPWVTFDKNGNAYASTLGVNGIYNEDGSFTGIYVNSGVLVFKSTDKGQSWNAPLRAFFSNDANAFPDKPAIYGSTVESETVYLVYHFPSSSQDETAVVTVFQRSTDGANFFEDPIIFEYNDIIVNGQQIPPVYIWGGAATTLPDGTLLVTARNSLFDTNEDIGFGPGHNEQILVNRSTDGGKTFGSTIVALPDATQTFAYDAPNNYFVRDTAVWHDIAVNNCNGYVYIATQDSTFNQNSEPDGFEFLGAGSVIIMSKDGGLTWSEKIPVNPTTTDSQAYMATVAVLKDGTVGVFYYTDRNHDYTGDDGSEFLQQDVYLSLFDKDLNYLGEKRVTPNSFNLRKAPVLSFLGVPSYYIGDYIKCATDGNDFLVPLPIPKSHEAGFPLPAAPDEYTVVFDQQYTKFARVSPNLDSIHEKKQLQTNSNEKSTQPLLKKEKTHAKESIKKDRTRANHKRGRLS